MSETIEQTLITELSDHHVKTQALIERARNAVKEATESAAYMGVLIDKVAASKKVAALKKKLSKEEKRVKDRVRHVFSARSKSKKEKNNILKDNRKLYAENLEQNQEKKRVQKQKWREALKHKELEKKK